MYTAWSTVSIFVVFARIYCSVVTVGDEANGHVKPSSSRWFVQYGLDRVRWLALILGLCRCVESWIQSDMCLTSGVVGVARVHCSCALLV